MLPSLLAILVGQPFLTPIAGGMAVDQSVARRGKFRSFRSDGRVFGNDIPSDDYLYAFFEFAPITGLGMTSACACTSPTGAKGEALTFTRTGAATCSKRGLATTGIANGDLVVCASNNQPRVEPDADGVLGLRVEGARTNSALRSQELDVAAAWPAYVAGVVAPTVTADVATAPDGTLTGDRVEIPATSSGQVSTLFQGMGQASVPNAASFYIKGNGTSGTIQLAFFSNGGCTVCSYNASTWTRCVRQATAAATTNIGFGNLSMAADCGGDTSSKSAQDVFVWGWQNEQNVSYATAYIPTTSATATRNAETAYFAPSGLLTSPLSMAGSVYAPATSSASPNMTVVGAAAVSATESANLSLLYGNVNGLRCYNNSNIDQRVVFYSGNQERAWCDINRASSTASSRIVGEWPTGTALTDSVTSNTGAGDPVVAVRIGDFSTAGSFAANGIISRICLDPTLGRCR